MDEDLSPDELMSEDPEDRRVRQAHGFAYHEPYEPELLCRNGCGLTYGEAIASKIERCEP